MNLNHLALFFGWIFFHLFFGAISICGFIAIVTQGQMDIFSVEYLLCCIALYFAFFFVIRTSYRKRQYQKKKNSFEEEEKKSKTALEIKEKKLSDTVAACNNSQRAATQIASQITLLEEHVETIKNKLIIYYQKNIIPTDYRNILCVAVINYVFRNDQADTMREATLICDQRIQNERVIEGLRDLSQTMRGLGNTLNSLLSTIDDLNQDVKCFSASQDILISETKASRYATEALLSSTERLEWAVRYH